MVSEMPLLWHINDVCITKGEKEGLCLALTGGAMGHSSDMLKARLLCELETRLIFRYLQLWDVSL